LAIFLNLGYANQNSFRQVESAGPQDRLAYYE
jgi:hypothetical protein